MRTLTFKHLKRLDVKLTLFYTVIVLLLSITLSAFYYYHLKNSLMIFVDKILSDEANELIHEIKEETHRGKTIVEGCRLFALEISDRKHYQIFFRLYHPDNSLLFESDNFNILYSNTLQKNGICDIRPENTSKNASPTGDKGISQDYTYLNKKLIRLNNFGHARIHDISVSFMEGKPNYRLQIATITEQADAILNKLFKIAVFISPLILVVSLLGGILVSRESGKVLKLIIQKTRTISSTNLSERLPVPEAYDEIQKLIITINTMLDRLDSSFNQTRQFSSDVSHELRTPLFALKGQMEVTLTQSRTDEEYRDSLAICIERTDRMIKMVNDLFLITRYDSHKVPLDLEFICMGDLIAELYDFYLPITQDKGLDFTLDLEENIIIHADKIKILQLLNNLIENAVYFTDTGDISISLGKKQNNIVIRVTDTGIGIPYSSVEKVFDRFYQVNSARSGSNRGSGLGLQICKRIVEAHKGTIRIEQNRPCGTTVVMQFPISS